MFVLMIIIISFCNDGVVSVSQACLPKISPRFQQANRSFHISYKVAFQNNTVTFHTIEALGSQFEEHEERKK